MIIKNSHRGILPQQIHNLKGQTEQHIRRSQVIQSDASYCNFREALIVPEIG